MNLEELQIKIGIELKELNKQLKKASDDINEYIGPKATKKMMADNNKVIKRGLDEISRTTMYSVKKMRKDTTKEVDDMSKDINKSLTEAFDIDLTKFNKNIDIAMTQAKRSVRSACNDIKRELNAALNVRTNIRVSASTSMQRQGSGSRSDASAMIASNQYNGAMIVKAINGMINADNKNTSRLEGAVNKSTNKIVSAINKQQNKKPKVEVEAKAPDVTINVPEIKVPDIEIDLSKLDESINKLGDTLTSAISSLEDVIKSDNRKDKPVKVDSVAKPVAVKGQGQQVGAGQKPSVFNQPKQQPKVFKEQGQSQQTVTGLKPSVFNSPGRQAKVFKGYVDDEYIRKVVSGTLDKMDNDTIDKFFNSIKEITGLLSVPMTPKGAVSSIISGTVLDMLAEKIKISPNQENTLIHGNIAELQRRKEQLQNKRDALIGGPDVDTSKINLSLYRDLFDREIEQVEQAIEQLRKSLKPIELKTPKDPNQVYANDLYKITDKVKESLERLGKIFDDQVKGTIGQANGTEPITLKRKDEEERAIIEQLLKKDNKPIELKLPKDPNQVYASDLYKITNKQKEQRENLKIPDDPNQVYANDLYKITDKIKEQLENLKIPEDPNQVYANDLYKITDKIKEQLENLKIPDDPNQIYANDLYKITDKWKEVIERLSKLKYPADDPNQVYASDLYKTTNKQKEQRERLGKLFGGQKASNDSGKTTQPLTGEIIDPEVVPVGPFKQIQDIIEVINYKVKDFETGLVEVSSRAASVAKELNDIGLSKTGDYPLEGEVIDSGKLTQNKGIPQKEVIIPAEFKIIDDELQEQINDAVKKIKAPKLQLNVPEDDATKKLESIKEQILEIQQEFDFIAMEELPNFAVDEKQFKEQFGSIEEYASDLYDLYENLQKLDDERIKLDIDTEDAKKQIKDLQEVIATYIDSISNGEFKDNIAAALGTSDKPQGTQRKPNKNKPPRPTIMGFGFGAFKNEIEAIGELARKVGSKVKKSLSDAFKSKAKPETINNINRTIENGEEKITYNGKDIKDLTPEELKNYNKAINDAKNAMNGMIGHFSGNLGDSVEEALNGSVDSFSDNLEDSIRDSIKNAMNDPNLLKNLKNKGIKPGDSFDETFTDQYGNKTHVKVNNSFKEASDDKDIGNYNPEDFEKALKAGSIEGAFEALEKGVGIFGDSLDDLDKELKDVDKKIIDFNKGLEDIGKELKDISKSISEDLENIKKIKGVEDEPKIKDVEDLNSDELEDFNSAMVEVEKEFGNFNEAIDGFDKKLKEMTESISNSFGNGNQGPNEGDSPINSKGASDVSKATGKLNLAETAKKVGSKIKKALSTAFHPIEGPDKLDAVLTRIEKKAISVFNKIKSVLSKIFTPLVNVFSKIVGPIINVFSKVVVFAKNMGHKIANAFRIGMYEAAALVRNYGFIIKTHLNKIFTGIKSTKLYTSIASGLNKAKSAVSKFASKVRPILNKAFDGIKVGAKVAKGIASGLNKAKGVLSKFANSCKTIWGKIKQIFSKGASDASKATGKLTTGLKALLAQAMGFFSLYALINLGKQAITQSGQLAQAESKLTALMRQRMGATNDTIKAIRQLAEEQAKAGVVSENAMVRGAEQLSRYVSSAKALQTLMPAIANMTALRGGLFATPEDAEEIATQLGEAIREGTTTPLEQSGIYLSEAEIKKFQALRTEEERAAYLADVIAKNVGNLNEQLANTPHGAIAQLKNNFMSLLGTLGTLLVNVIQPIVKWLNTIVVAANNALKALGELLGFDMTGGGLAGLGDVGTGSAGTGTSGVDGVTDSYKDAADAAGEATEANEKFKGSLMGFDEINTLSDNTNKDSGSGSEELDPTDISAIGGQLIPTEITEGESIFDKFGEKMKAFMDEILEPFKNAWALLGDRWKQEWGDLLKSCENFTTSLARFLKSVWDNGGKEFVQHLAEIGLACGIAAMEIGGEILDSLARLWDHLDPSKNMNTQGFLNALNEVSVKVRDFVLGLGDHFESLMANGGQDVLNSLGDMCMNFGEAATRGFGVAIDALDGLIDHLDPANNDFTKDMLKAWEEAFDSVGQCALDFAGLLESTLVNGGQEIINSLGDLGMKIGEAFGVLVDECAQTLSELFKHMDPATNPHSKKMLESIDGLVDSVTGFVDACIQAFKKFMDSGGRDFVKNLGDILAIVIDLAAELGSGIIDIITGFMNSWAGQALIEGVAQALKWVTEKLVGLSDAFDVVKDIFRNIVDIIVGIFEGDGEKVGRAFANLIKNAFKLTGELLQWLLDLGLDLVKGLVKGICALPKLLWEAVQFLFDTIVGFFKELFGIHSPSTVFAELGGFLIEGLVNGITGAIKLVTDAFKKIGEAILGAAKDVIKTVSEKFKDMKETIKEKLNEAKEVVSEKWKDMKETVSEKAKEIYNITKEKWSEVKQTISEKAKESYEVAKENWTNIKQTVSEKTKEAYESIKENWKNIKQTAVDIFTGTYETTKEKWSNIKDTIADKTKSAYEAAKDKWADIKQTTTDRFKESYETVKDRFTNIKDTVKEKATKTYEDVSDAWTKIKDDAGKKLEQIKNDAESRYKDVKDVMVRKVNEAKEGIVEKWEEVRTKTNECIENVKTTAEDSYNKVKETIAKKLDETKSNTEKKWEEIKKNTSDSVENIRKEAEERYGKIKESLTSTLEKTKSDMSTKWENIKKDAIDKAQKIATDATTKFADIKSKFSSKMDEVKTTLASKWDSLKTQGSKGGSDIVSGFQSSIKNIGSNLTSVFSTLKTTISNKLKDIGKLFTGANWTMKPSIKLPHIKIDNYTELFNGLVKVPKFKVEWYKRGGIIDGITPLGFANGSLHMGGESGKELVMPLENTSFTSKIAMAIGQAVDNTLAKNYNNKPNNNNNGSENRDVVLQIDGREFARTSINQINKLQRESGRTLLDI